VSRLAGRRGSFCAILAAGLDHTTTWLIIRISAVRSTKLPTVLSSPSHAASDCSAPTEMLAEVACYLGTDGVSNVTVADLTQILPAP